MSSTRNSSSVKLSEEFAGRLASLPPNEKLHAVVLLEGKADGQRTSHRQTRDQRRAPLDALRKTARSALVEMDHILTECGGRRLDDNVSALGTVAVEATPAGIRSLARLKNVKTVLEDQKVSLLK